MQRVLADKRLAEKAGWDREILAIELQALVSLDFEVELTGFETAEVDLILEEATEASGGPGGREDETPVYKAGPAVTRPGEPKPSSCSRTHPTTFRSTAMSAVWAESGTPILQWAAAR